jgi:hypothetical protein
MKSCSFLDDVETMFMGTREQYTSDIIIEIILKYGTDFRI